jgi:hypothetical protein
VLTHEPSSAAHASYTELFDVYRDAQRRLVDVNHRLHDLTSAATERAV